MPNGKGIRTKAIIGFGDVLVATTTKRVWYMEFAEDKSMAFCTMREKFPNAKYKQMVDTTK